MPGSPRRHLAGRRGAPPCTPLSPIPDEIGRILDADGEADGSGSNPGRPQLVVVQLPVGRAGRVDAQALCVADVGQVRPQTDAPDEVLAGGAAAAAVERE